MGTHMEIRIKMEPADERERTLQLGSQTIDGATVLPIYFVSANTDYLLNIFTDISALKIICRYIN